VLRPGIVGKSGDNQLARERKLSELNPDLPVDTFLVEGIVFASDTLHGARPNVDCRLDLIDVVVMSAPVEEVEQG
jgi:hypothetical protein